MRRVALVWLATVVWPGSVIQARAQSRMGGPCARGSMSSSSSLSTTNSPGFSAFNGNGSTLSNGMGFGLGTSSMMGGGFGSGLDFAAASGMSGGFYPYPSANAFSQGGNGLDGFNTGFGMGAINGQGYAQAGLSSTDAFGNITNDPDTVTIRPTNAMATSRPRARSQATETKTRSKSKSAASKPR
jgi:hypothetical protein